jgi:hypothetical protein
LKVVGSVEFNKVLKHVGENCAIGYVEASGWIKCVGGYDVSYQRQPSIIN